MIVGKTQISAQNYLTHLARYIKSTQSSDWTCLVKHIRILSSGMIFRHATRVRAGTHTHTHTHTHTN